MSTCERKNGIIHATAGLSWCVPGMSLTPWRGGDKQNVTTKMVIANQIIQINKDEGVNTERTGSDIHMKINHLDQ